MQFGSSLPVIQQRLDQRVSTPAAATMAVTGPPWAAARLRPRGWDGSQRIRAAPQGRQPTRPAA